MPAWVDARMQKDGGREGGEDGGRGGWREERMEGGEEGGGSVCIMSYYSITALVAISSYNTIYDYVQSFNQLYGHCQHKVLQLIQELSLPEY